LTRPRCRSGLEGLIPTSREAAVDQPARPSSGPAELHYRTGDPVRLSVVSDTTITVALLGYGINRTVAANRPTAISFRAQRPGNYPLVVTASHIAVARITVGGPAP
jgi:hypothetical protein